MVFMGTPDYAATILRSMIDGRLAPVVVVTQPDRPAGRGKKLMPPPVKALASDACLEVLQPEVIDQALRDRLASLNPDVFVVAAFGKILGPKTLALPKWGCVNAHASLLPRFRGASPVAHAILEGDDVTGVTAMMMDKGIDTGDILLQEQIAIDPEDTAQTLLEKLAAIAGPLMVRTLQLLEKGQCPRIRQDEAQATYAPLLTKQDGRLDFAKDAASLERQIRAFSPWPGAFTTYGGDVLKVHKARTVKT